MMKRMFLGLVVAAALAGCGSSVKLDDVPVEDKSGTSVGTVPTPGGGDTAQTSVAPVKADATSGNAMGPAGVARIVYFDYDSYVIKPEFQALIEANARFLKAN